MGIAPTWLRQLCPLLQSHHHFNHCVYAHNARVQQTYCIMVWYGIVVLTSHSTQYRSFRRRRPWAVMYMIHLPFSKRWPEAKQSMCTEWKTKRNGQKIGEREWSGRPQSGKRVSQKYAWALAERQIGRSHALLAVSHAPVPKERSPSTPPILGVLLAVSIAVRTRSARYHMWEGHVSWGQPRVAPISQESRVRAVQCKCALDVRVTTMRYKFTFYLLTTKFWEFCIYTFDP